MRFPTRTGLVVLAAVLLVLLLSQITQVYGSAGVSQNEGTVTLTLIGWVANTQDLPVDEAEVRVFIGGEPQVLTVAGEETQVAHTSAEGFYIADLELSPATLEGDTLAVVVSKPGYRVTRQGFARQQIAHAADRYYIRVPDIVLPRVFNPAFFIATAIFFVVFTVISFNVLHETIAAFVGAAAMLGVTYFVGSFSADFWIISFHRAIQFIDFDVIFLLLTMMIFMAAGATSAVLNDTTVMLLMAPVSIQIALALKIQPASIVVPEVLASNIGGAATLIGTPPNTIIGSYVGLSFNQFLANMLPIAVMGMILLLFMTRWLYRTEFGREGSSASGALVKQLEAGAQITNPGLLRKSLLLFGITMVLFFVEDLFHMPPAVVAILGSTALLLWVRPDVGEMLREVDWTTLVFFMCLFMMVGGVQEVGLIQVIAESVQNIAGSAPNIVAAGILDRAGFRLKFADFSRVGVPVTFVTLLVPTLWILLRYFVLKF
ncbi:MAG: SLC13 family permease [Anaerolineae bacterium]